MEVKHERVSLAAALGGKAGVLRRVVILGARLADAPLAGVAAEIEHVGLRRPEPRRDPAAVGVHANPRGIVLPHAAVRDGNAPAGVADVYHTFKPRALSDDLLGRRPFGGLVELEVVGIVLPEAHQWTVPRGQALLLRGRGVAYDRRLGVQIGVDLQARGPQEVVVRVPLVHEEMLHLHHAAAAISDQAEREGALTPHPDLRDGRAELVETITAADPHHRADRARFLQPDILDLHLRPVRLASDGPRKHRVLGRILEVDVIEEVRRSPA